MSQGSADDVIRGLERTEAAAGELDAPGHAFMTMSFLPFHSGLKLRTGAWTWTGGIFLRIDFILIQGRKHDVIVFGEAVSPEGGGH